MRVFLYEHLTGGGLLESPLDSHPGLLQEGLAMLDALAADLSAVPGVHLVTIRDHRLPRPQREGECCSVSSSAEAFQAWERLVREADRVLLIAPESDGTLLRLAMQCEQAGAVLVSPSSSIIRLAADKTALAQHLAERGVLCPPGILLAQIVHPPDRMEFPVVLKPNDGVGSDHVWHVPCAANWPRGLPNAISWRCEAYCPGVAVSVAFLSGPAGRIALPPMTQRFRGGGPIANQNPIGRPFGADETERSVGALRYCGGGRLQDPELIKRAIRVATQAIDALPCSAGYLGVDLVLGNNGVDNVIEINPRLTTSYVGLRRLSRTNLGLAMLQQAEGNSVALEFDDKFVEFHPDGMVTV